MPEHAARVRRLADRIKVIVAQTLEMRIKDPRLGFVTITDVRVTNDLREATIFYTVLGDEASRADTAAALESASDNRVLGTADDGSAESDHSMNQVGTFAGRLSGKVSPKTPTDESHLLVRSMRKKTDTFQQAREQIRHIAGISAQSPAVHMITQQTQIALEY